MVLNRAVLVFCRLITVTLRFDYSFVDMGAIFVSLKCFIPVSCLQRENTFRPILRLAKRIALWLFRLALFLSENNLFSYVETIQKN